MAVASPGRTMGWLIDLLPTAVCVCEAPSGVILRSNRRAAELWGREPTSGDLGERFCGAYRLYLTDGTPLPHARSPMADVLRSGEPARDREMVIERPDGSGVTVLASIEAIRGEGGRVVAAVSVFQDITGRKRMEQAFRASEERLRAIVQATPECVKLVARREEAGAPARGPELTHPRDRR